MRGSEAPATSRGPGGLDVGTGGLTTALATLLVLGLLAMLLWIVGVNALAWFWPARIWQLGLDDGRQLIGELCGHDPPQPRSTSGGGARLRLKVGNRELDGRDFLWIDADSVVGRATPPDLVRVVRSHDGDAYGRIAAVTSLDGGPIAIADQAAVRDLLAEAAAVRQRQGQLQARLVAVRLPLTRAEEQLDVLERALTAVPGSIAAQRAVVARRAAQLEPELGRLRRELSDLAGRLEVGRVTLDTGTRRLEIPLGRVLDVVWSNRLDLLDRLLRCLGNGVGFLTSEPRAANTEGGIFPALFGTVMLVLLMSVAVMPLGVLTAVYMTEYARDGRLLRLATHAVNNLAGIPSIVIGMFGLTFFVYGIGGAVDRAVFPDNLPKPTFGTGGILWASLTLALLTIPVVVVATREGLTAVPRGWRDAAAALGATQWQTLRRVVLPAAMPGILTGLILAVSRAAGEVAPLMLTGAVKLAPSLPVDGRPPFVHLERKFMHLGFHIYDVSMQSPNVEAAKPMAFATTLVLLALVVAINLTAIVVRRRVRRRLRVVEA